MRRPPPLFGATAPESLLGPRREAESETRPGRARSAGRAFTLLEVMVAIAILGVGLTGVLSAQVGAFKNAAHARNISVATGLLRCKMGELEEQLLRDGFQELDETDSGACCEDDETPRMRCEWRIEKPELPEAKLGELDLDADLDLGGTSNPVSTLLSQGAPDDVAADPGLAALGATAGAAALGAGADATALGPGAGPGSLAQTLVGGSDGMMSMAGVATGVMGLVYPDLKSLFEASTRRVTVKLTWTEGDSEYAVEIVQWVTNPQQAGIVGDLPETEEELTR